MKISVTKTDWDLAKEQTKDLYTTNTEYQCRCAVAQAVKRTYPDGCLLSVNRTYLIYEGIIFLPAPPSAWPMRYIVDQFDSGGIAWPEEADKTVDLVLIPTKEEIPL